MVDAKIASVKPIIQLLGSIPRTSLALPRFKLSVRLKLSEFHQGVIVINSIFSLQILSNSDLLTLVHSAENELVLDGNVANFFLFFSELH